MLALPAPNHALLFEEVANSLPLSSETLRRVREETNLIINGGSARQEQGPSQEVISSKSSKHSQTNSTNSVTKQGATPAPNEHALKGLQETLKVQIGILTVFVPQNVEHSNKPNVIVEPTNTAEPVHSNTHTQPQNLFQPQNQLGTWSSIVAKNIHVTDAGCSDNAQITFNEDGSATLKPPLGFLSNARKLWETSLIGHFIGGSFDFKIVRDQAFKMRKNKGLSRVFYSSKGYFTFKFSSVKEKNDVLALNSVQIGGRILYLASWMEANKFKKNVIESVPCWVKFEDIAHSYWSREGLTHIAKAVGIPLKFDENTTRFKPLRFASVQVMLSYSSPRPDFIWVLVEDELGGIELMKVSTIFM